MAVGVGSFCDTDVMPVRLPSPSCMSGSKKGCFVFPLAALHLSDQGEHLYAPRAKSVCGLLLMLRTNHSSYRVSLHVLLLPTLLSHPPGPGVARLMLRNC